MVWNQLDPDRTHVAYACLGFFTVLFALCSSVVKEKLFFGEATVSAVFGLVIGPHCFGWFDPHAWGNPLYNTLEISRILLCIELVAVGIELPPRYVYHKRTPLCTLLFFAMVVGWLVFAAFVHWLVPGYSFAWGLLVSACVTATDPVLAQAIIGKSKFASKYVPLHLKRLLTAESACNDGLAVPFVYLALNIIVHSGNSSQIAKNFICITVLYECLFGCVLGASLGYASSWAVRLAKKYDLIDNESNIFFPVAVAFFCAGISPILGIDDLLASFCAGCGFVWDDWYVRRREDESFIDSLDVFLNISYFIYFGSIVPWEQFNNAALGLNAWRLVVLAIVFLTLRRFPAVLMHYKINPEIRSFKEAIFVGHFGPIGVSGIFACILAISDLEVDALGVAHGPVVGDVPDNVKMAQLINSIFPLVSFLVVVSIIVHGSSAAFIVFSSHLKKKKKEHRKMQSRRKQGSANDTQDNDAEDDDDIGDDDNDDNDDDNDDNDDDDDQRNEDDTDEEDDYTEQFNASDRSSEPIIQPIHIGESLKMADLPSAAH